MQIPDLRDSNAWQWPTEEIEELKKKIIIYFLPSLIMLPHISLVMHDLEDTN